MPWLAPRHCPHGHPAFTGPRCPFCHKASRLAAEVRRPSARQRGYTREWQKASKAFLALPGHERCVTCGAPATVVDHRIAHKGNHFLFWDQSNWQPMCKPCNSRKAIQHEGGFGHAIR